MTDQKEASELVNPHHSSTVNLLRQRAAIELRVPRSGLEWLDAMINESRRLDYAGNALVGILTSEQCHPKSEHRCSNDDLVDCSFEIANAMLSESVKEAGDE